MLDAPFQRSLTGGEYDALRSIRVRAYEIDGRLHLRLKGFSPLMMFIATLCVAIFVLSLTYPLATMFLRGAPIPPTLIAGAVMISVLVALFCARQRARSIRTGRFDLIIDDRARAMSLPLMLRRPDPTTVEFERIEDIMAASVDRGRLSDADTWQIRHVSSKSPLKNRPADHRIQMLYAVVIRWQDDQGEIHDDPIVLWSDLQRTLTLTDWLRRHLGLPVELDDHEG